MVEISKDKYQITACVSKVTVEAMLEMSEAERRTFSYLVDVLLAEAVEARKRAKNASN